MTPFDLVEPETIEDAIEFLDADDPSVRPIGGGTALMLMMKAGVFRPTRLVSLRKLGKIFSRIEATPEGGLAIGAIASLRDLERSHDVVRRAPVIVTTMRRLANVRIRNVATVGGNLAHGDPHMDLPPVLMALGASVSIVGRGGERTLAVEDLFAGYYETVLARDELISELHIPPQGARRAAYLKCTTGSTEDWPALGVAVSLDMDKDTIKSATVVASAATERAIRLTAAEAVLAGARADDATLRRAGDAAAAEAVTVSDIRGSAAYKRDLLRVYVARAIRAAFDGTSGAH